MSLHARLLPALALLLGAPFVGALPPAQAVADIVVAARTLPARTVLAPDDLAVIAGSDQTALAHPGDAIGLEARVTIYAGRPVRAGDLGPPALIERNAIVTLHYREGALEITAEARALDRAGIGESLRLMNLASRTTVTGIVGDDGRVRVSP